MSILKRTVDTAIAFAENVPFLPVIFYPVVFKKDSEFSHLLQCVIPDNEIPNPVGTEHIHPERWFYLNGVASNRFVWYLQAKKLSKILNKKVEALFNPTQTILIDFAEVVVGRLLRRGEDCYNSIRDILAPILQSGQEVHVVAYSQGGIIISNVVRKLIQDGIDVSKLYVHTFASAHEEFDYPQVFSEHFANGFDCVSRSGVLKHGAGDAPVYKIPRKTGHLINSHYLDDFAKGKYCDGKSNLFSFVK